MICIYATKKLRKKLPLRDSGRLSSSRSSGFAANDGAESPISNWHANIVVIKRRQCVLFVHDDTLFPVFVPALTKKDFAELDFFFSDAFMNTILKTCADDELMEAAHATLGPLTIDTTCDRSVQGTMNRMVQELAFQIEYDDIPVSQFMGYRLGAWLANRPCRKKGVNECIWPIDAMHSLLLST